MHGQLCGCGVSSHRCKLCCGCGDRSRGCARTAALPPRTVVKRCADTTAAASPLCSQRRGVWVGHACMGSLFSLGTRLLLRASPYKRGPSQTPHLHAGTTATATPSCAAAPRRRRPGTRPRPGARRRMSPTCIRSSQHPASPATTTVPRRGPQQALQHAGALDRGSYREQPAAHSGPATVLVGPDTQRSAFRIMRPACWVSYAPRQLSELLYPRNPCGASTRRPCARAAAAAALLYCSLSCHWMTVQG